MSRGAVRVAWSRSRRWLQPVGGVLLLAAVVWRVGTGPFVAAVEGLQVSTLLLAVGIGAVTTLCAAWRWSVVAGRLGAPVGLPAAVAASYRSQLVNAVLPGGVLGDVQRAVRHGRQVGDTGLAARAVVWERAAGQLVQAALAVALLVGLPSPFRVLTPVMAAVVVGLVAVIAVGLLVTAVAPSRRSRAVRLARTVRTDLRRGVLSSRAWPQVVLASTGVVAGCCATFLVAARAAGTTLPVVQLLPLAVLVLVAMAVPANVAGWGPREGVAAWAFATAGAGAAEGVTTAVLYGVLVLAAGLPGLAVLVGAGRG